MHLVVRGAAIEDTMSEYLVERILASPTIEVHLRTEVVAGAGDGHLERLTLADRDSGERAEVAASWLFIFIGASPRTDWLGDEIVRDDKGFVITGSDLKQTAPERCQGAGWSGAAGALRPRDEPARGLRRR